MKVLVTGVTGRVGRNLAAALVERGDSVRGLVLPDDPGLERARASGVECVIGNLRDAAMARAAVEDVDAVVHLGAMMLWGSDDHNPVLFEDNLRGTFNLVNAAAVRGGIQRFVFASSDEVYPSLDAKYLPIDENHPTEPYSFYGITKLAGEELLHYYHRANNLPVSIARFALVIEPWETARRDGWLGRFLFLKPMLGFVTARAGQEVARELEQKLQGDDTLLLGRDATGAPYQFHCVDVRDVVQGLMLMLEKPAAIGAAFNLSGPAPFAYDQAIPYLAAKTGLPFVDASIPGPALRIAHSTAKARALLGYTPQYDIFRSIDDGLATTRP
ncbi:MAG: UDP-glucose 4-epimerase [Thermomicrobiales bacterium]|jgi:UDP-glucose 4-epimerase|nr:UDP-glucose 4-epimerase [Thermomicrobiales bacterium]